MFLSSHKLVIFTALATFVGGVLLAGVLNQSSSGQVKGRLLVTSLNAAILDRDFADVAQQLNDTISMRSDTAEWVLRKEELLRLVENAFVTSISASNFSIEEARDHIAVSFDQTETMLQDGREVVHSARYKYSFVERNSRWKLIEVYRGNR